MWVGISERGPNIASRNEIFFRLSNGLGMADEGINEVEFKALQYHPDATVENWTHEWIWGKSKRML